MFPPGISLHPPPQEDTFEHSKTASAQKVEIDDKKVIRILRELKLTDIPLTIDAVKRSIAIYISKKTDNHTQVLEQLAAVILTHIKRFTQFWGAAKSQLIIGGSQRFTSELQHIAYQHCLQIYLTHKDNPEIREKLLTLLNAIWFKEQCKKLIPLLEYVNQIGQIFCEYEIVFKATRNQYHDKTQDQDSRENQAREQLNKFLRENFDIKFLESLDHVEKKMNIDLILSQLEKLQLEPNDRKDVEILIGQLALDQYQDIDLKIISQIIDYYGESLAALIDTKMRYMSTISQADDTNEKQSDAFDRALLLLHQHSCILNAIKNNHLEKDKESDAAKGKEYSTPEPETQHEPAPKPEPVHTATRHDKKRSDSTIKAKKTTASTASSNSQQQTIARHSDARYLLMPTPDDLQLIGGPGAVGILEGWMRTLLS
jgi:hypothetical protein